MTYQLHLSGAGGDRADLEAAFGELVDRLEGVEGYLTGDDGAAGFTLTADEHRAADKSTGDKPAGKGKGKP